MLMIEFRYTEIWKKRHAITRFKTVQNQNLFIRDIGMKSIDQK